MLAQKQILRRQAAQKLFVRREEPGIILRLKARVDLDLPRKLLLQRLYGSKVALRLLRTHAETGIVVALEHIGAVIGKSQHRHAAFHGFQYVLPVLAFRMAAARGVGME